MSFQTQRYHHFLSHDWKTSRWAKFWSLLILGMGKFGPGLGEEQDMASFGFHNYCFWSFGCGSKICTQTGTLVDGNLDYNLRAPGGLILTHSHFMLWRVRILFNHGIATLAMLICCVIVGLCRESGALLGEDEGRGHRLTTSLLPACNDVPKPSKRLCGAKFPPAPPNTGATCYTPFAGIFAAPTLEALRNPRECLWTWQTDSNPEQL